MTRSTDASAGRALLPAHPRLPRPLAAGLADPQAKGNPAWAGGTAAGGTVVALERQAREPPSAVLSGMGEHPAADQEADWTEPQRRMMKRAGRVHGLRDAGLGHLGRLADLGRHRGLRQTAGRRALVESLQYRQHGGCSCHRPATRGLPALGDPRLGRWFRAPTTAAGRSSTPASPCYRLMPPRFHYLENRLLNASPGELR